MIDCFQQDPLFELFTGHSSYSFGFNNPVMFGDPSGMAPEKHKSGGDVLLGSDDRLAQYLADYSAVTTVFISYVCVGVEEIHTTTDGRSLNPLNLERTIYQNIYEWKIITEGGGVSGGPGPGGGGEGGLIAANDNGKTSPRQYEYDMIKEAFSPLVALFTEAGEYASMFDKEALHTALDIIGVADPYGVADGLNAIIYLGEGEWTQAGLSAFAIIPIVGDLAKGTKAFKFAGKVGEIFYVPSKYAGKVLKNWPWNKNAEVSDLVFGCVEAASKIVKCVDGGEIIKITNKFNEGAQTYTLGEVVNSKGELIAPWFEHYIVKKGDWVYDRITGGSGMHIDEYKKLFKNSDWLKFE